MRRIDVMDAIKKESDIDVADAEVVEGREAFTKRLAELINEFSMENGSDTPDFILAEYLVKCLENFNDASNCRLAWHA
jgi:hypothetical protein